MRGCAEWVFAAVVGTAFVALLFVMSGAAISRSVADWRHAGAIVQVAEQETEQTRIEWAARTEIARIEADADKKTSFAFVVFYLVRYGVWVAFGLMVLAVGLWVWGEVRP
jgi:hypothetical protein